MFLIPGKNPVWNQTFKFSVISENEVHITIKDDDVGIVSRCIAQTVLG